MPDVVLPVLNEAEAIPWVLERMPAGYEPIVVDNGSTDGSGALAARLGARVVVEPTPGFGAACFAGLCAADDDLVCFMDCDGSLDPADLPDVAGPVLDGSADLVLGSRMADRGAWPVHARLANRVPLPRASASHGRSPTGPGPDACRSPSSLAGAGDLRSALRLATRDGDQGDGRRLAHHRSPGPVPRPLGPLEGHGHGDRHPPGAARHGRGAA